ETRHHAQRGGLAAAEGPSSAKKAPRGIASETSATARWEPNRLETPRISRTAACMEALLFHAQLPPQNIQRALSREHSDACAVAGIIHQARLHLVSRPS